jgi:hypothetical protein
MSKVLLYRRRLLLLGQRRLHREGILAKLARTYTRQCYRGKYPQRGRESFPGQ